MLGEIAFDHPLFAPLAGPAVQRLHQDPVLEVSAHRRRTALGEARVLARFENGDPAVIEKALGKGRLVVLASGWSPADSQLARSSKFVPLMSGLLDGPNPAPDVSANVLVHDRVPLPPRAAVAVRKPDGSTIDARAGEPRRSPDGRSPASIRSTRPTARARSP